jgi:hypothetical protein
MQIGNSKYLALRIISTIILIWFGSNSLFCQPYILKPKTKNIENIFINIYNFSLDKADSLIINSYELKNDKINLFSLKAYLCWWKIIGGENTESNLGKCDFYLKEVMKLSKNTNKTDPVSQLNIINAYSLKSRIDNHNGNNIKAFYYFYNSIGYFKNLQSLNSPDEGTKLAIGLYNYLLAYINKDYSSTFLFLLDFPKGDKVLGLKNLEGCSQSRDPIIMTEATYFLFKIYYTIEKDYNKAFDKISKLRILYPANFVFDIEYLKVIKSQNKNKEFNLSCTKTMNDIKSSKSLTSSQKLHFMTLIKEL